MENYLQISPYVFDCKICPTPCDGISKMHYVFEKDATFSEGYEQKLIDHINLVTSYKAKKTTKKGYPDVEVKDKEGKVFYIELKVQQRTFMSVEKNIPESGLKPSETVALNLSDLKRYFDLARKDKIIIFLFWVVLNRPCVLRTEKTRYYYRLVSELKPIWEEQKDKRLFKRKSGEGDIVDGQHKGVTVNYHFSLKELKVWDNRL